ncbi:hypothetical protein NIES267_17800 [Calothrix parasitica NIES-267]|uniref:Uncharacterized protein n=1 Tax=Calothrix parasitica NIES-267 TaxID=1973488 RepID=A0A1Z4LM36_9CYAN|nr:hypothetical protein NIES267_17800 [Calothrix parasitica NIES-267]
MPYAQSPIQISEKLYVNYIEDFVVISKNPLKFGHHAGLLHSKPH